MAQVNYPADAYTTEVTLQAFTPGQITHNIPSTGNVVPFNLGPGRWQGTISWKTSNDGAAIEAAIAALNGAENWMAIPLRRPTIETSVAIRSAQPGLWTLASAPADLANKFVRFGQRVYVIVNQNGNTVSVWPLVNTDSSGTMEPTKTINIHSTRTPELRATPHWSGPWTISWRERISSAN